jgi:hypothetical protein
MTLRTDIRMISSECGFVSKSFLDRSTMRPATR